jgi:hypothetical protein
MKLYFIGDTSDAIDIQDLFVWARDPDDAIRVWRRNWQHRSGATPQKVWEVPTVAPDRARAVRWTHLKLARTFASGAVRHDA